MMSSGMTWKIKYLRSAKRGLRRITAQDRQRIKSRIEALAEEDNPQQSGEKLSGSYFRDFYRVRVGNYRIIYRTENDELILVIFRIGHRRDVYD